MSKKIGKPPRGVTIERDNGTVRATVDAGRALTAWQDMMAGENPYSASAAWAGASRERYAEILAGGDLDRARKMKAQATKADGARKDLEAAPVVQAAIYGGAVCVPAALAGQPKAFNRILPQTRPGLRVWVDLFASGAESQARYEARLVQALCKIRYLASRQPVELKLCIAGDTSYSPLALTVDVDPRRSDWARIAAFGHTAWLRLFGHGLIQHIWGKCKSGWHGHPGSFNRYSGAKSGDLVFDASGERTVP